MKMFYIFIGVVVSLVFRSVRTHQIGYSECTHSIEHKLYCNKSDFQKRKKDILYLMKH